MGWRFGWDTKRDLLEERIREYKLSGDGSVTCLAHCYRGGRFSGVLWSVWVVTMGDAEDRFIRCDVFRYFKKFNSGWAFREMRESQHPDFYSCPLSYLDMVPLEHFGGSPAWRDEVRAYHEARHRRLEVGHIYKVKFDCRIGGDYVDTIKVERLRPLRGLVTTVQGKQISNARFSRRIVTTEVP